MLRVRLGQTERERETGDTERQRLVFPSLMSQIFYIEFHFHNSSIELIHFISRCVFNCNNPQRIQYICTAWNYPLKCKSRLNWLIPDGKWGIISSTCKNPKQKSSDILLDCTMHIEYDISTGLPLQYTHTYQENQTLAPSGQGSLPLHKATMSHSQTDGACKTDGPHKTIT